MPDVLLVDDEEGILEVLTMALEAAGFTVVGVSDVKSALEQIREATPRLVVTDVYLPEMDGLELLIKMRTVAPGLPAVVMSGGGRYDNVAPLKAARHLGAAATLEKPFVPSTLLAVVRELLGDPV